MSLVLKWSYAESAKNFHELSDKLPEGCIISHTFGDFQGKKARVIWRRIDLLKLSPKLFNQFYEVTYYTFLNNVKKEWAR